jgi:hypothetical protein
MKQSPIGKRGALQRAFSCDGRLLVLRGRAAWIVQLLCRAGDKGCNPIKHPARWSEYIRLLRRRGVRIETVMKPHKGDFPGMHGIYVLRSRVRLLNPRER